GWICDRVAERRRHCHLRRVRDLPTGNGMDRRAIERSWSRFARCFRGNLRAARGSRCLPLLRTVRSAEPSEDRQSAAREQRRPGHDYAADQTVPRRKNVVCTFLVETAPRILATRAWREIFSETPGSDPLLMDARSHAVAAARGDSASRDP